MTLTLPLGKSIALRLSTRCPGPSVTTCGSGNKRNTVDLLQRGLAPAHHVERRIAEKACPGTARRLLQLAQRRAAGDDLAQLVVQDHELGDRLAALVARATAFPAAF